MRCADTASADSLQFRLGTPYRTRACPELAALWTSRLLAQAPWRRWMARDLCLRPALTRLLDEPHGSLPVDPYAQFEVTADLGYVNYVRQHHLPASQAGDPLRVTDEFLVTAFRNSWNSRQEGVARATAPPA